MHSLFYGSDGNLPWVATLPTVQQNSTTRTFMIHSKPFNKRCSTLQQLANKDRNGISSLVPRLQNETREETLYCLRLHHH